MENPYKDYYWDNSEIGIIISLTGPPNTDKIRIGDSDGNLYLGSCRMDNYYGPFKSEIQAMEFIDELEIDDLEDEG